jgi:diguanylate cyclase (GGDEF)-like protein
MSDDIIVQIVSLCLTIDRNAREIYKQLSAHTDVPEIRTFWAEMAREESEHVDFWKELAKLAEEGAVPQVFDKPFEVKEELECFQIKANALLERSRESPTLANAFLLAYRMEFFLLHPAFETLFNFMKNVTNSPTLEDTYDAHIERFIDALNRYGTTTPEMELVGETLQRLWRENRVLLIHSNTDILSGVLNRRGLFNAMVPFSHLAHRKGKNVGIMMIDLDDFKAVNDAFGHQVGDKVISCVGRCIKTHLRNSDLVGRYGGDEFLVYLSEVRPAYLPEVADKIRIAVESASQDTIPELNGTRVTVSIGGAQGTLVGDREEVLNHLIKSADNALYEAKRRGKNVVVIN